MTGPNGRITKGKPDDVKGGEWFVAVGANTWGRGRSIEAAVTQNVKAGGNRKTYLVYKVDVEPGKPGPYVDDFGNVCYSIRVVSEADGRRMTLVAAMKAGKVVDPATVEAP